MKAPVQNTEIKPKNPVSTSFADPSTTSPFTNQNTLLTQSAVLTTNPRAESDGDLKNLQKKTQPLLFSQGLNIPQQPIVPKKEPLRGIYAFFGSETLPLNQK